MRALFVILSGLLCASGAAGQVHATVITLDAVDRGWYTEAGSHSPTNLNYVVGDISLTDGDRHNFFVFDLSGVTDNILSATLSLVNPANGYVSGDSSETYDLYDVTTSTATLTAGTAGIAGYTDLGSGVTYGSYTATAGDNGTTVLITLNSAAIAALDAAGGLFAVGGTLATTLDVTDNTEQFFGFTSADVLTDTQLILTTATVPEPSSLALLGIGSLSLFGYRFRRRKAA